MVYSHHFLSALGAWQRGWREDPARREANTTELLNVIAECNLPNEARSAPQKSYRKRFLVPNNPQNEGHFVPLIVKGSLDDEGVASWTTELKFAQDFKDPLREGTVSAVFGHSPLPAEVVLNIPALWNDPEFQQAVEAYSQGGQPNASALQHFNARQSEVILNCPLRADEIEGFCGRSSPFELLCDSAEFRKRRLGRRFGGGWSTGESSRNNLCG